MADKKRSTSKLLLWTVVIGTFTLCAAALIVSALFRDTVLMGIAISSVVGLAGVALPVTASAYENKSQAENIIKISQGGQLEELQEQIAQISAAMTAMQEEIAALRKENNALKRKNTALENKLKQQEEST